MSNKINIDELLKQELGNMTPEPPAGIWENVSNQVQLAQPAAQTVNSVASATKTVLVGSKVIATTAIVVITTVAGFVGYKLYNSDKNTVGSIQQTVVEEPGGSLALAAQPALNAAVTAEVKNEVAPERQRMAKSQKNTGRANQSNRPTKENGVAQPVYTDQPDKAIDPTDPLVVPDQQANVQNETIVPKQNTKQEEKQVSQPVNNEQEEQSPIFEAPFIPNVFTPNVDGKNDEFEIALENELLYDLKITDRKGNIVFESRDKNFRWQGVNIYTGKTCEEGMYVYAFKYQLKGMKDAETKSGWINLRLSQRQ